MKVGDKVYILKENNFYFGSNDRMRAAAKEGSAHTLLNITDRYEVDFNTGSYWFTQNEITTNKDEWLNKEKYAKTKRWALIRNFLVENKDNDLKEKVDTNLNYLDTYEGARHYGCCSITKNRSIVKVFIPKRYLELFGYNEEFLVKWINFVKGLGFNCEYQGFIKKHPSFTEHKTYRNGEKAGYYITKDFYKVLIDNNSAYINYFNFILLRYCYNHYYWQIPTDILEIRKQVKEATDFQCVLMAHYVTKYYNYYSLIDRDNFEMIDIFASTIDVVKEKVTYSGNMNSSYIFTKNINHMDAEKYAKVRDWQGLYNFLKNAQ